VEESLDVRKQGERKASSHKGALGKWHTWMKLGIADEASAC